METEELYYTVHFINGFGIRIGEYYRVEEIDESFKIPENALGFSLEKRNDDKENDSAYDEGIKYLIGRELTLAQMLNETQNCNCYTNLEINQGLSREFGVNRYYKRFDKMNKETKEITKYPGYLILSENDVVVSDTQKLYEALYTVVKPLKESNKLLRK